MSFKDGPLLLLYLGVHRTVRTAGCLHWHILNLYCFYNSLQLGGKKTPHQGTIPFWLYIVPTDLVSVFLDVGNLQITYIDMPTRFSSHFLYFSNFTGI